MITHMILLKCWLNLGSRGKPIVTIGCHLRSRRLSLVGGLRKLSPRNLNGIRGWHWVHRRIGLNSGMAFDLHGVGFIVCDGSFASLS